MIRCLVLWLTVCVVLAGTPQAADRAAMVTEVVKTGSVILAGVCFEPGRAAFTASSEPVLAEVRAMLLEHAEWTFEVQVHNDEAGSLEQDRALSASRADVVVDWLATRGIARSRLAARGYGSARPLPIAPAAEPALQHRRVELRKLNEE